MINTQQLASPHTFSSIAIGHPIDNVIIRPNTVEQFAGQNDAKDNYRHTNNNYLLNAIDMGDITATCKIEPSSPPSMQEEMQTTEFDALANGPLKIETDTDSMIDDAARAPDHHARRPMNAFLIFCKRHRAIVREKYPTYENRQITKILGDWWANLDKDDKTCFNNLAKQYKDAFLTANPTFKWYKLPAPPLRTVASSTAINNATAMPVDYSALKINAKLKTNVGIFKLADETQMGGLNSLMVQHQNSTNNNNNNTDHTKNLMQDLKADLDQEILNRDDALHRELGETGSYLERTIGGGGCVDEYVFFSEKSIIPNKNDTSPDKSYEFYMDDDDGSGGDTAVNGKKSSRACKGKRYQEFMNIRKTNALTKKPKSRTTSTSSASLSPTENMRLSKYPMNAYNRMDCDTFDHLYANHTVTISSANAPDAFASMPVSIKSEPDQLDKEPNTMLDAKMEKNKFFDASDFELEEKIKALPALSLDKYLCRKHDTKKKKKVRNNKRHGHGLLKGTTMTTMGSEAVASTLPMKEKTKSPTIEEVKAIMVGSQKRKARKESITRRDITSTITLIEHVVLLGNNNTVMQTPKLDIKMPENALGCPPDLMLLAEVSTALR